MAYPNGCHVCEVEVEPETGHVEVVRYVSVNDFGVIVNPLLVEGQAHGGIAQGIGQALYESVAYSEDGQLLSGSYQDYCLPRAGDLPDFGFESAAPRPARPTRSGAKGCGEAGCAGSLPAVMNALVDALCGARRHAHRHAGDTGTCLARVAGGVAARRRNVISDDRCSALTRK